MSTFDPKVWKPLAEYDAQIDKRVKLDRDGRAAADDLYGIVQSDPEGAAFEIVALRRLAAHSAEEIAALVECETIVRDNRNDAALSRLDAARKERTQ